MSCLQSPRQGTKDLMAIAILRYPFGAGEMPAVGTPPAPRPCGPAAGPNLLASLRL